MSGFTTRKALQYGVLALVVLMMAAQCSATEITSPGTPKPKPPSADDSEMSADVLIFACGTIGILFAIFLYFLVAQISLGGSGENEGLVGGYSNKDLIFIYDTITAGAKAFLKAEYTICFIFVVSFGFLIFITVSHIQVDGKTTWDFSTGALTALSFVIGALTSMLAGYIGMMVAVFANARTAVSAQGQNEKGWTESFNCAFRAGGVMGYSLCALSLMILYLLCLVYRGIITDASGNTDYNRLFECIAGYGLGGSAIAMFGRVGGGIFTKAADVGADLAGKVIGVGDKKLDEDSPYNPACIADNVGDNVGDVAGMGSDLFGSFGEASCAAMLIGAASVSIQEAGWSALVFPLFISALGIIVCMLCSFVATDIMPVKQESDIEKALKWQLGLTSLMMTITLWPLCAWALPAEMTMFIDGKESTVTHVVCYFCIIAGLWGGCLIGFITDYKPVRDVARSTETGAATNIIYGLALGYQSAILPVTILSAIIFLALQTAGMYGVALAALGMLSTLSTCLTIDVYGPISDNAGGIAEMVEMDPEVREKTDALDAAGNTTAAIGKGFAIGSAALVSLALFGAFVTRVSADMPEDEKLSVNGVNLLSPVVFAFLVFGAMIPYWFSALTMRSVGEAANAMVKEVARQFAEIPGLANSAGMDFHERRDFLDADPKNVLTKPDYERCIKISTDSSLREMIAPGVLVIVTPILVGTLCGVQAVAGMLTGAIASSVQLAISMSNTGGAWDNAKKYTEKGELNGCFPYRDGAALPADWYARAENEHGNACLEQKVTLNGQQQKMDIKQWLSNLEKSDEKRYKKIMAGEEGVQTISGRNVIYSGKKSQAHAAAVVGDTVGDPLKDTSGPALNIVMKLMAIISVVFADFFMSINNGNGMFNTGGLAA